METLIMQVCGIILLSILWLYIRQNRKRKQRDFGIIRDFNWQLRKFREAEDFYCGSGQTGVKGYWPAVRGYR